MPMEELCLNLITPGSKIHQVTSITPSSADFLYFLYFTWAAYHLIGSLIFRYASQLAKQEQLFLNGTHWSNNVYYIVMRMFMQSQLQRILFTNNTGLNVLTGIPRLSNKPEGCILSPLKQLCKWDTLSESMLNQTELISDGLLIILWNMLSTKLYIS